MTIVEATFAASDPSDHMDADKEVLTRQLEEINLIKYSVLPDELLAFVLDADKWTSLLEEYPCSVPTGKWPEELSNARFQVKVDSARLWFEVNVPREYPHGIHEGKNIPVISVKCEDVNREEQEKWQKIVEERWREVIDSEAQYPLHVLICLHLLPELHDAHDSGILSEASDDPRHPTGDNNPASGSTAPSTYHVLFTSHHLISPQKRRSLQQWSSLLSLAGFAKLGYPGVIYAEGPRENLQEFVSNVKSMQWLALRLRFIEPLLAEDTPVKPEEKRWVEFEKVGEVVQEMKRLGREKYVLETGIGSVGAGASMSK